MLGAFTLIFELLCCFVILFVKLGIVMQSSIMMFSVDHIFFVRYLICELDFLLYRNLCHTHDLSLMASYVALEK
jgi:hypothetical protein